MACFTCINQDQCGIRLTDKSGICPSRPGLSHKRVYVALHPWNCLDAVSNAKDMLQRRSSQHEQFVLDLRLTEYVLPCSLTCDSKRMCLICPSRAAGPEDLIKPLREGESWSRAYDLEDRYSVSAVRIVGGFPLLCASYTKLPIPSGTHWLSASRTTCSCMGKIGRRTKTSG